MKKNNNIMSSEANINFIKIKLESWVAACQQKGLMRYYDVEHVYKSVICIIIENLVPKTLNFYLTFISLPLTFNFRGHEMTAFNAFYNF